jgi:16S rRNA (cytidine1402-2'-O)-methyltransferase
MQHQGKLYLIPTGLGGPDSTILLPAATQQVLHRLQYFVVEAPKAARAFLKSAAYPLPLQEAAMQTLDEHTAEHEIPQLLAPLQRGHDCGLLSDAGCPAVADPGAGLVRLAHAAGIPVVPLVGPSALLLALMASGLNGQRFTFHGYLAVEAVARARQLATLESASRQFDATQMFIETPYRNRVLFEAIVAVCQPDTLLCVASDLTLESESVRTQTIAAWKTSKPVLDRRPTVFLLYRGTR